MVDIVDTSKRSWAKNIRMGLLPRYLKTRKAGGRSQENHVWLAVSYSPNPKWGGTHKRRFITFACQRLFVSAEPCG